MNVLIIDYGMSNLCSIKRAVEKCHANVFISENPGDLALATHIILPGVGAFKDGMNNLNNKGWPEALKEKIIEEKVPILGICLGMQLLASKGYEGGEIPGLNFIEGEVRRLEADSASIRIPHAGWNEIYKTNQNCLFDGIPDGTDFYFVHSYHFIPQNKECIISTTPYCGNFASAIMKNNIIGVQFHPEKSQQPGLKLLHNFFKIC